MELGTLGGHTNRVFAVAWSPDGRFICSGSLDRTIKVWDSDLPPLPAPPQLLEEITLYPNQTRTVTAHSEAPPLTWTSSDPRIAHVDAAGTVTAHAEGSVSVTVMVPW